jgi:hypothetical protein
MIDIARYGKYWAVYYGELLVCVCVYQRGAEECKRVLSALMRGVAPDLIGFCLECRRDTQSLGSVCEVCGTPRGKAR